MCGYPDRPQAGTMTEQTMTDIPQLPPPPPPRAPRPPLRRSNDKVLGGVAGGVARWLDIDPTLVRVVLVVLAVFGGSGLLLYAIGWLLIPAQDASASAAQDLLDRAGRPGSANRVLLIILGVCVAMFAVASIGTVWLVGGPSDVLSGGTMLLLATGALVAWLLIRDQRGAQPPTATPEEAPAVDTVAAPAETLVAPAGFAYGGTGGGYAGYQPAPAPVAPRPPRRRSYLGLAALSVSILVMGTMTALTVTDVASIPAVVVLASGLGVLGLGILVGAFGGRATWLLTFAVPLLLLTALVAVVPAQRFTAGSLTVGDIRWHPSSVATLDDQHRLAIGKATLDLTGIPAGTVVTDVVTASVGIGTLIVIVPADMAVDITASVGAGSIQVAGQPEVSGSDRTVRTTLPAESGVPASTVDLDLEVGLGTVEVSRG